MSARVLEREPRVPKAGFECGMSLKELCCCSLGAPAQGLVEVTGNVWAWYRQMCVGAIPKVCVRGEMLQWLRCGRVES